MCATRRELGNFAGVAQVKEARSGVQREGRIDETGDNCGDGSRQLC